MAPRVASHGSRAVVLVVLGSLAACNGGAQQGGGHARDAHGTSSVGGQVVSTVNGMPVTLGEVRDLVEHGGLDARTALRRLQDERLLAVEARRRGHEQAWSVFEVGRKASAQALLQRTAEQVAVSDVAIDAAYAAQRLRFEKPERRVCVHMLAQLSPKATPAQDAAARAAVERLEPMLASATDLDGFVRAYHKVGVD